jgi:biotin carboxylase
MGYQFIVLVGFGRQSLSHFDRFLPARSVIVAEDPDVIVKRRVAERARSYACVRDVIPARYHQDGQCVDAVVRHCHGMPVAAVIAGVEYGVPAAAAIAAALGLPGASPRAAEILSDKLRMREITSAAGIYNPQWRQVRDASEVSDFAAGGPVVLKPANRQASLGVQLLAPGADAQAAWRETVAAMDRRLLPDRPLAWRYLAERTLSGQEYSAEALVHHGSIAFLNITAKRTAPGRHPVELGHVVPAPLPAGCHAGFAGQMARLVEALRFGSGILHAEWMATGDGLAFIECAGRAPGDSIVDLIDAAYGFSLVRELVSVLSGRAPSVPREPVRSCAVRFLTAPPGTVTRVSGTASARDYPGVVAASVDVAPGDRVGELRSSWDRVGEVIATGATPELADKTAAQACALIQITTVR